jgi:acetyl esterase/lipase
VRDSHDILSDPPPPAADARLVYGPQPLQFGDLRLPASDGPFPLLVVVHGGYWKANWNLIHAGHLCVDLAARGIATWNVEYRRVGDVGGGWPATAEDVGRALAFTAELAMRYSLDLDRVALLGHSAGGHLALCNANRIPLRAVFAVAAVCDVEASVERRGGEGAAAAFLGGAPAADASPLRRAPLGVPTILVHGTADETVPFEDSVRYAEAAGDEARLVRLEGAGHFEPVDPQAAEWQLVAAEIERSLGLR